MTEQELLLAAKVICTASAIVVFMIGAILGAVLETKFNFWKW